MTEETKDKSAEDETPKGPVTPEDEAFRARLKKFISTVTDAVVGVNKNFLQSQKSFYVDLLVDLVHGGLETLKHYLEDPAEKKVTWDDPWVESRFVVKWDWDFHGIQYMDPKLPEDVFAALRKGEDPEVLARSPKVREVMTEALVASYYPIALEILTHQVAAHVKGGQTVGHFFLDPHLKDEMDALPTQDARDAYMEDLLKPFSIGGVEVEDENGAPKVMVPFAETEDIDPAAAEVRAWYEKVASRLTRLFFTGKANGTSYRGSVVFMIHNLVVDEDLGEAYFPIVTGLSFVPADVDLKTVDWKGTSPSPWEPASWDEEERKELWENLLGPILEYLQKTLQEETQKPDGKIEPTTADAVVPPAAAQEPSDRSVALEPYGSPPPERRYLLDAPTRIDREALVLVAHVGTLNLPRSWKNVKPWSELEKNEVQRLRDEMGDEAFKDLRKESKNPNAHGRLLVKKTNAKGETEIKLAKEAEDALLETVGYRGFRKVVRDPDGLSREYLIKRFRAGSGYIEARLSWYGQTWPLVDEGREERKKTLQELQEKARQGVLFDKLSEDQQKELDGRLRLMESIRDAQEVMISILERFGAYRENPLRVPAWNLRTLLECENDPNGFRRVEGCLRALQEVRFFSKATKIPGISHEAFGSFLGEVRFVPGGPGRHRDGDYYLSISPAFIGCLKVWQTAHYQIREPHKLLFDWSRKLTKEEKKNLKGSEYVKGFSSLGSYYDRARGFTSHQRDLRRWIESEITRKKDGTKKGSPSVRVSLNAKDADEPRSYNSAFCPILPAGKFFHGALSHFGGTRGEHGRTLYGTPTAATKTSGAHKAGLLRVMNYSLPPGDAKGKRQEIARKALQDMRAVVEEAFGGVVAGCYEGRWISLKDAETLPVDALLKKVTWFLFLALDWRERIPKEVEEYHEKRRQRGDVDYRVKVTEDRGLVERTEAERGLPEDVTGPSGESLWIRLYSVRRKRNLSQKAVGQIFGVSQAVANYWERGTEPGEDGKVPGRPIPADVAPLIVRWVETGETPTAVELAAINARRQNKPGKKKDRVAEGI